MEYATLVLCTCLLFQHLLAPLLAAQPWTHLPFLRVMHEWLPIFITSLVADCLLTDVITTFLTW